MTVFLLTVDEKDAEIVENFLRGLRTSGLTQTPVEISESKPIPTRRRARRPNSAEPGQSDPSG
jgi:hypothetical protein